jgi:exoribonuclease R
MRVRSADGADPGVLRRGEQALQTEMHIDPAFPAEVEQEAADAVASPTLPELDRTEVPFVTIDPEGSRDLDQALHLRRRGQGYTVHYAIADVAAFVRPVRWTRRRTGVGRPSTASATRSRSTR